MKRHIPTLSPFHLRQGFGGQVVPVIATGMSLAISS